MTPKGYDAERVDQIARTLYLATKTPDSVSWAEFKRHAEWDATAKEIIGVWHGLAIAALDLTYGVRARLGP